MIHLPLLTLPIALFLSALPFHSSAEVIVRQDGVLQDHTLVAKQKENQAPPKSTPDPVGDDLILFNNGDLMHGTFGGLSEGLFWERSDIARPIKFGLPSVKQIVFNSTRRLPLAPNTSFITLISGDRIPGQIISLDDKELLIKSPIIGELTLPRNLVSRIAPNPFGGELHYIGPYHSDGWLTLENVKEEEKEALAAPPKAEPSAWIHSGTAFYSQGTQPLILADANLPDTGRISFNVAWKGRLSIALALHSDLIRVLPAPEKEDEKDAEENEIGILKAEIEAAEQDPEKREIAEKPKEEKENEPAPLIRENLLDLRQGTSFQSIPWINSQRQNHANLFGTGYTLSLQSGYPTLTRNFFNNAGSPRHDRLSTSRSNANLSENGEAQIEIRFNRSKSLIMLYIDGIYSNQWHDLDGYLGTGTSLGFLNRSTNSKVRISEIIISSWEGSTDSAISMEHPDRDIALLNNGTDRFSGSLTTISEGLAHFETEYSKIKIPLPDLALINFSQTSLIDLEANENLPRFAVKDDLTTIIYQPFGLLKVSPLNATPTSLTGHSPFLGKITIDLNPAVLLRFHDDSPDLSSWFDDF